jgi:LemA protein
LQPYFDPAALFEPAALLHAAALTPMSGRAEVTTWQAPDNLVSMRAMSIPALVTLILLGALVAWAVVAFNLLIRDRNRVKQSWSDVSVQLLRRHELVPRLVELVKGYAGYEKALLTSLTELRDHGERSAPRARGAVEKAVESGVHRLIALVETYPDLKASQNFLELHRQLADTENQIQYARRYYNGAVNLYNNRLQKFPDVLIASVFGFQQAEFFQLENEGHAVAPAVSL